MLRNSHPPLAASQTVAYYAHLPDDASTHLRSRLGKMISYALNAATLFVMLLTFGILWGLPTTLRNDIPSINVTTDYAWAGFPSAFIALSLLLLPIDVTEWFSILALWFVNCIFGLVVMLWYESFCWFLDPYSYFYTGQTYLTAPESFAFGDGANLIYHLCSALLSFLRSEFH